MCSRHRRGSAKKAESICILLLVQRSQNVLDYKVMTGSPREGFCSHIEQGGEEGKEMTGKEQHKLGTSIMQ